MGTNLIINVLNGGAMAANLWFAVHADNAFGAVNAAMAGVSAGGFLSGLIDRFKAKF